MVDEPKGEGTKGEGGKGGTSSTDGAAAKIIAPAAGIVVPDPDDLSKVITSKFTDEQKDDYIEKLKDENARRRIATKKEKDKVTKQETSLSETQKELDKLKSTLSDFEKQEKDRTDAEKSAMEKLSSKITEIEKSISEKDTEIQNLKKDSVKKDLELGKSSRERKIDRLVHSLSIEFTSEYERSGLVAELMVMEDGEFTSNDEELLLKLQDFAKDRKKKTPETPGAGPLSKTTAAPLAEEINQLLAKPDFTLEDKKRLDEMIAELEKLRTQGV